MNSPFLNVAYKEVSESTTQSDLWSVKLATFSSHVSRRSPPMTTETKGFSSPRPFSLFSFSAFSRFHLKQYFLILTCRLPKNDVSQLPNQEGKLHVIWSRQYFNSQPINASLTVFFALSVNVDVDRLDVLLQSLGKMQQLQDIHVLFWISDSYVHHVVPLQEQTLLHQLTRIVFSTINIMICSPHDKNFNYQIQMAHLLLSCFCIYIPILMGAAAYGPSQNHERQRKPKQWRRSRRPFKPKIPQARRWLKQVDPEPPDNKRGN
ncbi:hypothetical protein Nepgr_026583 [Nepenthes gracilis]|uniref:Uncharacterized protein n=1 Tax=Nepenthes gracilis TaxID=150966 RepID=A0AAD3T753_NEPGR|nr:hypothetical protein Nepgr_026583 [Nepenthes gracilis]